jgi:CDP-4-dehydro-6-deoxyglucose reductase, E1
MVNIMAQNNLSWPLINDNISFEDKKALSEFILTTNRFTNGPKVAEFEKKWSKWLGVKYSVMVNSGAMANFLSIAILKEIKGFEGEVIVSPIGWVSDVASILHHGFTPVFVDIDLRNLSITTESIKKALNEKTCGIVLVHCLGFNAISESLIELVRKNNILLIEDCCEAHGATYGEKKVGVFGDISCFSFYYGHHMTTIEGGMVCTNDENIYEHAKLYRSHGMTREVSSKTQKIYVDNYPELNPLFTFAVPGYNVRSTEINAVLGIKQIKRLDENIRIRKNNLEIWLTNLDSKMYYTDFNTLGNSNFALPLILVKKSRTLFNNVQNLLKEEGVEFRVGTAGGGNQALQPYLKKYNYLINQNLDITNHVHCFGLYVGNHTELSEYQISTLCINLNEMLI